MHTSYSFRGQTIAIRYYKVYIFEHVWRTQGMIPGRRFQGKLHALVPIGDATFHTGRSLARGKKLFRENKFLHTYCKHQDG
jgi:hypothetical protein